MPFLRFSILFAFFAFSFAWADCEDDDNFEIFANGVSLGCDDEISTEITYGDTLTFTISPPDTGIYTWTTSIGTIIKTGSTFTPKCSVSENPPEDGVIETYKVRKKGGSTKPIEVTIMGRPTFTVSFDTNDDDNNTEIDPQVVMEDSLAKIPTDTLTKAGYTFGGWDFDFKTPIKQDTTIKAIWIVKIYVVSFDSDGGTPSIPFQKIVENGFAKEPKDILTRKGYSFKGWDFDFEKTPITKDTTIKAIWDISDSFVGDTIVFEDHGFYIDTSFSSEQRNYFVFSPRLCEIKDTSDKVKDTIYIKIATKKPMILKKDSISESENDLDGKYMHYKIPFTFKHRPGLDTLTYEWFSIDGQHIKSDTILIETPIPFKTVIGQKWNNVLFVNNNPKTNGGYKFTNTDYEWFKNNEKVGDLQFYSTGQKSNALYQNDIYRVKMLTTDGNRISTCEDTINIKPMQPLATPTPKLTKQVLGIKEKSLSKDSKVYNLNGKLTKETPAGVYIVKEK